MNELISNYKDKLETTVDEALNEHITYLVRAGYRLEDIKFEKKSFPERDEYCINDVRVLTQTKPEMVKDSDGNWTIISQLYRG